jgi:hypothetical protein
MRGYIDLVEGDFHSSEYHPQHKFEESSARFDEAVGQHSWSSPTTWGNTLLC